MASPSSSPSPPPPPENKPQFPPLLNPNLTPPSIATAKKPQPIPWTHQETVNLIQAYQEKWYSLKRGQLKSSQWEEVSVTVAARCGYDEPSKSATQCRHKIEKLRKRYRAERLKPYPDSWPYFDLMDNMESGPLPVSVARPTRPMSVNQPSSSSDSDLDYNLNNSSKSKSINRIVKGGNGVVERNARVSRIPVAMKRKEFEGVNDYNDEDEEVGTEDEEEEEGVEGSEMVGELAVQIREFSDKFVNMEHKKIEMMRDTEKYRMEMENKRMQMIMESQRKLVDTIHKAFDSSHKKMKMAR